MSSATIQLPREHAIGSSSFGQLEENKESQRCPQGGMTFGRSDAGGGRAGARSPTQPLGTRGTSSPGGNHLPDLLLANAGRLVQALHNSLQSKIPSKCSGSRRYSSPPKDAAVGPQV